MSIAIKAAERGWLPDPAVRAGIRHLLKKRIQQSAKETLSGTNYTEQFAQRLRQQPLAPLPDKANEQHYEVPSSFFEYVLGPRQ